MRLWLTIRPYTYLWMHFHSKWRDKCHLLHKWNKYIRNEMPEHYAIPNCIEVKQCTRSLFEIPTTERMKQNKWKKNNSSNNNNVTKGTTEQQRKSPETVTGTFCVRVEYSPKILSDKVTTNNFQVFREK